VLAPLHRLATIASTATLGQEVDVNPTGDGAPGGATIQRLLNWLGQCS
jgi:hypothetical protein